ATVAREATGADNTVLLADSSQTTGRKWARPNAIIAEAHADTSFNNDNTEKTYATLAIPQNYPEAGDVIRCVFEGELTNNHASAVTYTLKFKLGATTVLASSGISISSNATARPWCLEVEIHFVSAASERCYAKGNMMVATGAAGTMVDDATTR